MVYTYGTFMTPKGTSTPAWLVVLPRLYLAATYLLSDHGSGTPKEMTLLLNSWSHSCRFWYRPFMTGFAVHHVDLITRLVLVGELYVGFAMLLGCTTRLASVVSIFMLLNYWFAKPSLIGIPGIDTADIVLSIIVLFTAAGRIWGIDQFLYRRFPRVPIW